MKINELEAKISLLELAQKKGYSVKKIGNRIYGIEPCPVCGHKGHFTIYVENNSYCSFSQCCKGGKAYKFLEEVCGLTPEQAYRELCELAGEPYFNSGKESYQSYTSQEKRRNTVRKNHVVEDKKRDFTLEVETIYQKQKKEDLNYFLKRGLTEKLIKKYKLCVTVEKGQKSAILPIWEGPEVVAYTKRVLSNNGNAKYLNSTGKIPLFNADYLKKKALKDVYEHEKANCEILFVTEGIFDALSLEVLGEKAISLGGVNHLGKLGNILEKNINILKKYKFVTAFDNDEAGKNAHNTMKTFDKFVKKLEIPTHYKDVNSWHTADPKGFRKSVDYQKKNIKNPNNQVKTLFEKYPATISLHKECKKIKTGFGNLDANLRGIFPSLYILGGTTGVGKTTFVHQICEQMASNGKQILIFSLEIGECQFLSKSLSRQAFLIDRKKSIPSSEIISGKMNKTIFEGLRKFKQFGSNIQVFDINARKQNLKYIKNEIKNCIKMNGKKPFVVVDYLQIMPEADKKAYSDKNRIDDNVQGLKEISSELEVTIFLISSLNRDNYSTTLGTESFKESGSIEYTADVLLGFQLGVILQENFKEAKDSSQKKELLNKALEATPREIVVSCVKNRHGIVPFKCFFDYHSAYDVFEQKPFSTLQPF